MSLDRNCAADSTGPRARYPLTAQRQLVAVGIAVPPVINQYLGLSGGEVIVYL